MAAALLLPTTSFAQKLIVFDNPHLIAVTRPEGVTGYYSVQHQVTGVSCSFFFKERDRSDETSFPITSFRRHDEHVPGRVHFKDAEWVVQTEEHHDGCGGAVGSFRKGPGDDHPMRFTKIDFVPALGIRRVVCTGDVVVAMKTRGLRTHVRHVHPATGRVTTNWVETGQLEDPFSSQPDMLSRQVKYAVQPVQNVSGRRLPKEVSIESVTLHSGPGLSNSSIKAINAKLGNAVAAFHTRAAECRKFSFHGQPWGYESKLGKVVVSGRYVSVVFDRATACGGTPDFERDAFVFARTTGKLVPASQLLDQVFPQEEGPEKRSPYPDLVSLNDNRAEALMRDNAEILGDCDERCEYDVRNKSYRIWMEDGQMVFVPEFSQTMSIQQQEYVIKVTQ